MKKSHGYRSRSRKIMTKHPRKKGIAPLSRMLINYNPGDRVNIIIDPSVQKGQPHKRFHGLTGVIKGQRGRAYVVDVKVGNKVKTIIVRPDHLVPNRG